MASIAVVAADGTTIQVACVPVSRDNQQELIELAVLADPVTALGANVTQPGISGAGLLGVQGAANMVPFLTTPTGVTSDSATLNPVAVGTTSTMLLGNNLTRVCFTFSNAGPQPVFIAYGNPASADSYTYLLNSGDPAEFDKTWKGYVYAVCASGNALIHVTELN